MLNILDGIYNNITYIHFWMKWTYNSYKELFEYYLPLSVAPNPIKKNMIYFTCFTNSYRNYL